MRPRVGVPARISSIGPDDDDPPVADHPDVVADPFDDVHHVRRQDDRARRRRGSGRASAASSASTPDRRLRTARRASPVAGGGAAQRSARSSCACRGCSRRSDGRHRRRFPGRRTSRRCAPPPRRSSRPRSSPIVEMNSRADSRSNSWSGSSITPIVRRTADDVDVGAYAAHLDGAAVGASEPDDGAHGRRLARPVRTDQPVARAVRHGERQLVERHLVAEPLREADDPQRRGDGLQGGGREVHPSSLPGTGIVRCQSIAMTP